MGNDEQGTNGNGSGGDDLGLAADLDDWIFAGRGLFRSLGRLGSLVPPFGKDQAAECAHVVAASDGEFVEFADIWQAIVRPSLERHAHHGPAPTWLTAAHGDTPRTPKPPPTLDPQSYSDGYWIDYWVGGATHLLTLAEGLRECIPPADDGVAWSITSFHLPRVDEQFAWVLNGYHTAVRPRLQKYERRPARR